MKSVAAYIETLLAKCQFEDDLKRRKLAEYLSFHITNQYEVTEREQEPMMGDGDLHPPSIDIG